MIFRGPYGDVTIPEVSLPRLVFGRARERGGKAALIEGTTGRVLTYAELAEAVRSTAAGLHARGLRKGDVFAVYSPNCLEYGVLFHAVATLGGVTTTINPLYTAEEAAHQLRDARARFLIASPGLVEKACEAAGAGGVEEVFQFGEGGGGAVSLRELTERGAGLDVPEVEINPREDLVALPYSSGTTGLSKGVMLTHHNLVSNLLQIEGTGHALEQDTLVCVLPLFHIYGLTVLTNFSLYTGATVVVFPRFDLEQLLQAIQEYRVTMAHLVPPIVLALARHPAVERYDLSSLKTVFSGAAPLGAQVTREVSERLGCFVKQGYGMTETSPATHMTPHDPARARHGSVGWPVPNTECKIVELEAGRALGPGEEGEICVRGPQVMKGYLNRPDATAATIDAEGWLHTGDIGYADREGHFYIVDRAKELIKYKGFQVAPAELEAVLLTHPSVADAAVIPSPDPEAGEVPKAFVVLKQTADRTPRKGATDQPTRADAPDEPDDRHDATRAAILEFVAAHVAPHKKVRRLEFIPQIPKSPSGKILRRVLVERERERAAPGAPDAA